MANRDFKTVQAANRSVKLVAGRVQCSGANNPTITDGLGFSIARTAQGSYTITSDKYPGLLHANFQIHNATPLALWVQGGAHTENSVSFRVIDSAGVAQDLTAELSFQIVARNSTVK
jgi:hypothetical protein